MPGGCYGRRKRIYTEEFSDEEEEKSDSSWTTIQPLKIDFGTTINATYSRQSQRNKVERVTNVILESPTRTERVVDVFSSSPTKFSRSKGEYTPPTSPIRNEEKQIETKEPKETVTKEELSAKEEIKNSRSSKEVSAWDDLFGTIEPKSPMTRQLTDKISDQNSLPIDIKALVQSMCVPVETKATILKKLPNSKEAQISSPSTPIRSVSGHRTYGDTRSFLADRIFDVATEQSQMISDTHDYESVETHSKADFDMRILGSLQRRRDDIKEFLEGLVVKRGKPIEAANQMLLECLVAICRNIKSHSVVPDDRIVARLQILCNKFSNQNDSGSLVIAKLISVSFFYMLKLPKVKILQSLSTTTINDIMMAAKKPFKTEKLQVSKIALESLQQFICELPPQKEMVSSLVESLHPQPH